LIGLFYYHQYDLPDLKDACDRAIMLVCTPQNALELHDLAALYNLKEACKEVENFIKEYA
jgi:hypothetical protein